MIFENKKNSYLFLQINSSYFNEAPTSHFNYSNIE